MTRGCSHAICQLGCDSIGHEISTFNFKSLDLLRNTRIIVTLDMTENCRCYFENKCGVYF